MSRERQCKSSKFLGAKSGLGLVTGCTQNGGIRLTNAAVIERTALVLVGERHAETGHPEIVVRSADKVPGEVPHQANMMGNANFQTSTRLPDRLYVLIVNPASLELSAFLFLGLVENTDGMTSTSERSHAPEGIRCEPGTTNRIAKRKGSQPGAANVVLGIENKSLSTNSPVFAEEILHIKTTAPNIVATHEAIVADVPEIYDLSGELSPFVLNILRVIVAGIGGEGVCSPKIEIPFVGAIPLAWCRRLLNDFFVFAGIVSPSPG